MRTIAVGALLLVACSSTATTTEVTGNDAGDDDDDSNAPVTHDAGSEAGRDASQPSKDSGRDANESDAGNGLFATCTPNLTPSDCPPYATTPTNDHLSLTCFSNHSEPGYTAYDLYGHCTFDCYKLVNGKLTIDPDRDAYCKALGGRCGIWSADGGPFCLPSHT